MPVDEFIRRAGEVHGGKFSYDDVEYVNNRTPVRIRCPAHGFFEQTPYKHLSGQGCPKCAPNYKDTSETFIAKARKVHGDRYDYSKVRYVDEHTKVCIIDPEYGEFWQQPNAHLNGRGNAVRRAERGMETKMARGVTQSSTEDKMYAMLKDKFGDDVRREYWSERYPYPCDFYVPQFDLYIELNAFGSHGGHWFDSTSVEDVKALADLVELSKRSSWYKQKIKVWTQTDLMKRMMAIRNDLNYVVFWKNDLSDFMVWYDSFDFDDPVLKLY